MDRSHLTDPGKNPGGGERERGKWKGIGKRHRRGKIGERGGGAFKPGGSRKGSKRREKGGR